MNTLTYQKNRHRTGFTVLELLVTMTIIGVLAGLILPAVQQAREGARRIHCANNLKQIGLALHQVHEVQAHLPAGWATTTSGNSAWGWAAELLPVLEQSPLAQRLHAAPELGDSTTKELRQIHLPVMICPSDVGPADFNLYLTQSSHASSNGTAGGRLEQRSIQLPRANYVGIFGNRDPDESAENSGEGTFIGNRTLRWRDLTRGLSNVGVIGERTARRLQATWIGVDVRGEDAFARLTAHAKEGPNVVTSDECEMDSRHPGGINVLFADGHVQHINDHIDRTVYQAMARRQQ